MLAMTVLVCCSFEVNDRSNALAFVHEIEGFVDLAQIHVVSDELVDFECSAEIFLDEFWHALDALVAAEGCAFPHTSGD